MTVKEMEKLFKKYDDDFLKFEEIENPTSRRPDLNAFLLLDTLVPGTSDIVSAAEHDEIYLEIDTEALAAVISEDQILELTRCGIRFERQFDSLAMFV